MSLPIYTYSVLVQRILCFVINKFVRAVQAAFAFYHTEKIISLEIANSYSCLPPNFSLFPPPKNPIQPPKHF